VPEITAIKINKKNSHRRSVYVDGNFAFSISEGVFLKKGEKISQSKIKDFKEIDDLSKAKFSALNLISYRPRSEKEVYDKLIQKGWGKTIANKVVSELVKNQYIDDESFAKLFANYKVKNYLLGPNSLRKELYKKGLKNEIIEKTIQLVYDEYPKEVLIRSLIQKRGFKLGVRIEKKDMNKVYKLLFRKGYSLDDIKMSMSDYNHDFNNF